MVGECFKLLPGIVAGIQVIIYQSLLAGLGTNIFIGSVQGFFYHALVVLVYARLVGSHIAQYVLEGSVGTFYLGIGWEEWFVGKYLPVDYLSVRSGIFVGFAFLVADQFSMLSCHSSCILFHIAHIVLADIIVHVVSLTSLAGTF